MKRKWLSMLLAAAMLGTLLIGCAGNTENNQGKEEEITISYMIAQSVFQEYHTEMADKLKENENITVDYQVVPDAQFDSLLRTKIATGEVPDVFETNVPSGVYIYGVENMVDLSEEPWVERLVNPELLKYSDGGIYGLPKESSSFFGACYYNKQVLEDMGIVDPNPKTYQEFLDILDKIKEEGDGVTPIYMTNGDHWTTQIFATLGFSVATYPDDEQIYKDLLANEKKFTDVPEFERILTDFVGLYESGYVNENHLSAKYEQAQEAVATGTAAMFLCGEWFVTDLHTQYPDVEIGSFVIPFADKDMLGTGQFVNGVIALKEGGQVDNVKHFLNLWAQPEYRDLMFAKNPGFPGLTDIDGGDVEPSVQELVDEYIVTGNYTYQINDTMAECGSIWPELWQYYVEAIMGEKTPREVLEAWQEKYEDFMSESGYEGF